MTQLRLAFALTILAGYAGFAQSAPLDAPLADVVGQLGPALATHDPARLSVAYRAMGHYGLPAADIVESSVNASGYQHLENKDFDAAISVFELNTETFPDSANTWDSLGEAILTTGDHAAAIRYYRKSLELDPQNSNAALMIERLQGTEQPAQVTVSANSS